jgi:hypothetical protein
MDGGLNLTYLTDAEAVATAPAETHRVILEGRARSEGQSAALNGPIIGYDSVRIAVWLRN